ncbi:hypothetical protein GM658_03745 [Pseudoduganella eburnea]|uniref:Aerotolerance regulator N-terminal domain-containing protein n=1 Tax=Massilia eburnea TaxID=1776165 RepID=A0A6L6QC33_9BURK|nr:hypothetical protein [Massilia eburnea]MTW09705.1 hypothetical protein [Massilia eburnea]
MTSMQPLWWFALPVLLLPVWWHMRKRERTRTELLATARFLPAAAPQQQRMLRWSDVPLLLVRLALLLALIAWLAVLAMPWKGDTVFVDPAIESSPWTAQQIQAAGMAAAAREPLPADVWNWLALNEHEWRPQARFLILAPSAAMPALRPRLAHAAELRLSPPDAASAHAPAALASSAAAASASGHLAPMPTVAPRDRHVVVVAPPQRIANWQALFAAFSTAADGANRYVIADTPTPETELIVWDRQDAEPPPSWKAPLWWRAGADGQKQTPQGLTWTAAKWPLQDIDAARALYERWQAATLLPAAYPMPAQSMAPARNKPLPTPLARSPAWLALALMALFAAERILAHARRR